MKILLIGGGSGGPVSPLLAVAQEIKKNHPNTDFLLVGTIFGPEKLMAQEANITFASIAAGKFRRYFSFANFLSPFQTIIGFFQSLKILKAFRPNCVFGTGSFVQVPVVWAAWFLGIPVVLHQQDLVPSLANTLCQIPAKKITVTFQDSLTDFSSGLGLFYKKNPDKIILTGNPFREELKNHTRKESQAAFNLTAEFPTLLVLGGGTGSLFINNVLAEGLLDLCKTVQIIHATGKHKNNNSLNNPNYHPFEFIPNMGQAYAAADIILCRAGMSTITELSNLKKVSIIIPMPNSHQEVNAFLLMQQRAAVVATQDKLSAPGLVKIVRKILFDREIQTEIVKNISEIMPKGATKKIADIVIKLSVN